MKSPYDVIIKPVITEKTMAITEEGKYTFVVAPDAEKPETRLQLRSSSVLRFYPLMLLTSTVRQEDSETSPVRQLLIRRQS